MVEIENKSKGQESKLQSDGLSVLRGGRYMIESILLLSLSLLVLVACVGAAQESAEVRNVEPILQESQSESESRNARGLRMAQVGQAAYTGEFFRVGGRKVQLLRSLEKVAVRYPPNETLSVKNQLQALVEPQGEFIIKEEASEHGIAVLQTPKYESLDELNKSLQQLEQTLGIIRAVPVYIHEESGLELIATDEFIVKLAASADLTELQAINDAMGVIIVRPLWGTTDQFILTLPDCTPEELLSTCEIYLQDPAIKWAEPNFLSQVAKSDFLPNDPLYGNQWHLPKIQAPKAWDTTKGSSQVVVAIIDDGMDLAHEDLKANLWSNSLEIANNGLDDDNNGYVDDRNGWNFFDYSPDPNPSDPNDNHGTACAGVAAAKGNNNLGVTGCAFNCKLMPLKLIKGDMDIPFNRTAESIYYAAGRTKNGGTWRGADVISISWHFSNCNSFNDALTFAATQGRGGKGCPIFCSAGNKASGYQLYGVDTSDLSAGTYSIEFEYIKDPAGKADDDCVWIADVILPDQAQTRERFSSGSIPSGWSVSGNAGFEIVDDPAHAYGTSRYVARSGGIGNSQNSILRTRSFTLVPSNYLLFLAWVSSEKGTDETIGYPPVGNNGDWLFVFFCKQGEQMCDGWAKDAGVPGDRRFRSGDPIYTQPNCPASHRDTIAVGASTDFDYRAAYSQYGSDLDFVAPSNGGSLGIYTTDRTGDDGYSPNKEYLLDDPNYTSSFGGTSSSTPLAAGVAALILSKNPDLTASEVRRIMRESCDQIGNVTYEGGWNKYYGYGRINAQAALGETIEPKHTTVKEYVWPGAPVDVPDRQNARIAPQPLVLSMDIEDAGAIVDLNVKLNVNHTHGRELTVSLDYIPPRPPNVIGPSETVVLSDHDGSWTHGRDTIFDDDATMNDPMYKRPTESLSAFDDESITGHWILTITDHSYGEVGTLNSWSLIAELAEEIPGEIKLTPSDGKAGDEFGRSVSIDGDYAIVGTFTDVSYWGAAYIFKRSGSTWIQQTKLTSWYDDPRLGDEFGWSVSISGDYAIVGSPVYSSLGQSGSAYMFKLSGSSWIRQDKLTSSEFDASFGCSVSLDGDYAIVGAQEGFAYIFKRSGSSWTRQHRLTASDGAPGDAFGGSVSIKGNLVIVGASGDDDNGTNSGSAYTFYRDGTRWIQSGKLTAWDGTRYDKYGSSVSLSEDFMIIGAPDDDDNGTNSGSVYTYTNFLPASRFKLTASDGALDDRFGNSISISGDYAIVGAHHDDDNGNESGSAYLFTPEVTLLGTMWKQRAKLTSSDGSSDDFFGESVSISGDYAIVGAPGDDDNGTDSGSAYIFRLSQIAD